MMRSLLVGLLVLLCTTSIIAKFTPHECIYDQMQAEVSKLRANQKRASPTYATTDLPNASNTQNLRIRIDTSFMDGDTTYTCYNVGQTITVANSGTSQGQQYSCKATDIATASIRSYLTQTLIPAAVDLLSNTFKVVPVVGNLRVGGGNCPGGAAAVPIPSSYVTTGAEDTDLIVFVLVRPVVGSSALAYAAGCQDDQYGRTVVGYININPASTSSLDGDRISQVGTIAHELSHVLGFNSDKFSNGLRTSAGTGQSGIVTSGGVSTMVTENVVAFARTYFNCPNLQGALIENGGGLGTSGSHWEKEQWMNEYMTGISTQNPVFSGLTLSFFQDSGWYYIDFARAEQLFWGYQAGCNFAAGCEAWPSGNGYTCDKSNDKLNECTFDLQGKGYCDTDVLTSETCPYINGYNNAWCIDKDDAAKTLLNSGEEYCPECRCFTSSLIKNSPSGGTDQLVCYKTDCVNPSQLKVKVNDFWYNCNRKGDTVAAINFGGTIKCPDPALICAGAPAVPEQWPQILAINPDTGVPGSVVTITGKNFYNITQVYIAGDCTEVSVESPTKLTARLATYDKIQNPTNLLKAKANVIVTNILGHNDLIYQGYNLKIELNQDLADAALRWVKDKWYVVLIAGLVLGVFIFICYRCCCKSKKDEEGQHKGQHKGHKKHGGHQGQRRQTGGDVHMHQIQPQPGQQHQQEFYEAEPNYYENQQYYAQQQQQPQHHQQPPKRQLV